MVADLSYSAMIACLRFAGRCAGGTGVLCYLVIDDECMMTTLNLAFRAVSRCCARLGLCRCPLFDQCTALWVAWGLAGSQTTLTRDRVGEAVRSESTYRHLLSSRDYSNGLFITFEGPQWGKPQALSQS